ncbi:MAG: Dabb family protein [Actinomycetota bacterium]|nr:Dabb family protein [Actinomycetota bacterium]
MIRHIAMFRWRPDVSSSDVARVEDALRKLRSELTGLRDYRFGRDVGLVDGNWDFAVVADLHDEPAFRRYVSNAEHQRIISQLIAPMRGERAAVQLLLPE